MEHMFIVTDDKKTAFEFKDILFDYDKYSIRPDTGAETVSAARRFKKYTMRRRGPGAGENSMPGVL